MKAPTWAIVVALYLHSCFAAVGYADDDTQALVAPSKATYYIDPQNGDDDNSGDKRRFAWRSFQPLNQLVLDAGDRVEIFPGSFDHSLIVRGSGTAAKPIQVSFAPGRYDFSPKNAYREAYQISNSNSEPEGKKAVGILLKDAKHVQLHGAGARLVYHGKMIEICLDRCQDVSVAGFELDYQRPTVSEFSVTKAAKDFAELQIHPDSLYKLEEEKIIWYGEGWQYETGLAQEYDPKSGDIWRRRDPLVGLRLEKLPSGIVRAHGKHSLTAGRTYQLRDTFRDCVGVFTNRSRNITWNDVTFRFLHGLGLVSQFSENITLDGVKIEPEKESGRTSAAWGDCLHFSGCRGKITVKDCVLSSAHDDALNIHGTHLRVVEQLADKTIKVRFMHKQTFGFPAFGADDEVEFVHHDSLETFGANRVEHAKLISPREMILTLAAPVPKKSRENDVLENVTWTPEVEVSGCRVYRIPTRGFLITTRRNVLVNGNKFFNTRMPGILIENDASGWYESGCVRDRIISGNQFVRCGEPVIHVNPRNSVANQAVHQNITITMNEFLLRGTRGIRAKSTSGLKLIANSMYTDDTRDIKDTIETDDCANLEKKDNAVFGVDMFDKTN